MPIDDKPVRRHRLMNSKPTGSPPKPETIRVKEKSEAPKAVKAKRTKSEGTTDGRDEFEKKKAM